MRKTFISSYHSSRLKTGKGSGSFSPGSPRLRNSYQPVKAARKDRCVDVVASMRSSMLGSAVRQAAAAHTHAEGLGAEELGVPRRDEDCTYMKRRWGWKRVKRRERRQG